MTATIFPIKSNYYIGHATSLWIGLLGVLKAIFWPAVLVYEALSFFGG